MKKRCSRNWSTEKFYFAERFLQRCGTFHRLVTHVVSCKHLRVAPLNVATFGAAHLAVVGVVQSASSRCIAPFFHSTVVAGRAVTNARGTPCKSRHRSPVPQNCTSAAFGQLRYARTSQVPASSRSTAKFVNDAVRFIAPSRTSCHASIFALHRSMSPHSVPRTSLWWASCKVLRHGASRRSFTAALSPAVP